MKALVLFAGGGGVECGLHAAGITDVIGIEYDDEIAAVARMNGFNTITADVCDVDPAQFKSINILHASPPCPNFSVAKTGAKETEQDLRLAQAVCDFIDTLKPRIFTLENVYGYRKSESWAMIRDTLYECGYWLDLEHVNFANFGVPQTRKRMIIRAVRGGFVPYLNYTHSKSEWVGWYEAIEDLVDTLPDSEFAPWQLARLPDEMKTFLINPNRNSFSDGWKSENDLASTARPMFSLAAQKGLQNYRGFIMHPANPNAKGRRHKDESDTAMTITAGDGGSIRAFVVNGTPNDNGKTVTVNQQHEPIFTQTATSYKRPCRASLHGRVVQMTPRASARFQSFPDWYQLPEKKSLACKIIGNAVPPLGYQRIIEGLVWRDVQVVDRENVRPVLAAMKE